MKKLLSVLFLLSVFLTSCVKENESLPENIFAQTDTSELFEVTSFVYLYEEFKAKISFNVNFDLLSDVQNERISEIYVEYEGEPRTISRNRQSFTFPIVTGQEICVKFGLVDGAELSNPSPDVCKNF